MTFQIDRPDGKKYSLEISNDYTRLVLLFGAVMGILTTPSTPLIGFFIGVFSSWLLFCCAAPFGVMHTIATTKDLRDVTALREKLEYVPGVELYERR